MVNIVDIVVLQIKFTSILTRLTKLGILSIGIPINLKTLYAITLEFYCIILLYLYQIRLLLAHSGLKRKYINASLIHLVLLRNY